MHEHLPCVPSQAGRPELHRCTAIFNELLQIFLLKRNI